MSEAERYEAERAAGLKALEAFVGRDAVVPIDIAARFLPVLPEWRVRTRQLGSGKGLLARRAARTV